MSDVECPYCKEEQDIDHDDGYGYKEGETHMQECFDCEKSFAYTTSIHFDYYSKKADCLNGGKHKFKSVIHNPKLWPNWKRCEDCGQELKGKFNREL